MVRFLMRTLNGTAIAAAMSCATAHPVSVTTLRDVADAHGVAGAFAGVAGGELLVAGGANFPDGKMPWEGGRKAWHDAVFALDLREAGARWRNVGRLPAPNSYGVSVTTPEGVLVIGGSDAERHLADAWRMRLAGARASFEPLPPLPRPLAQMAGALVGRTVHVVGGIDEPGATEASAAHWALDLDRAEDGWRELPPLPAPGRILAVAAATSDALLVFGGCSLAPDAAGRTRRTYLRDAWKFSRGQWVRLADMPRAATGAASPAPIFGGGVLIVGGDDGEQLDTPPARHRGFTREILRYDVAANAWHHAGTLDVPAPVTLSTAPWRDGVVLVSGEVRPGVRTRSVLWLRPQDAR